MRRYYAYVLFDWLGVPRYVGKGCGNRDESHERRVDRVNRRKSAFIERTRAILNEVPKVRLENLTEREAFDVEIVLIAAIGRLDLGTGPLTNMTNGGDGLDSETLRRLACQRTPERRSEIARRARAKLTIEQRAQASRLGQAKRTPGQRSDAARRGKAKRTTEQRAESARRGQAKRTPKQRSEAALLANANRTLEQRRETARLLSELTHSVQVKRTPEQRSAIVRRGWITRRLDA